MYNMQQSDAKAVNTRKGFFLDMRFSIRNKMHINKCYGQEYLNAFSVHKSSLCLSALNRQKR